MLATLGALSRLVATPPKQATTDTVLEACRIVRRLLGAQDAYVIRAGDPEFIRMGCEDDPKNYEIKQRGYWLVWREAAARADDPVRMFTVSERLVHEVRAPEPGIPATHLGAVLPGDESNSEVLIVHGPWPGGLTAEQLAVVETITPLMAYLVANVLDKERHERLRSQMRVFADIATAFSRDDAAEGALGALATALARASGFAWVPIILFDPGLEHVVDRALNTSRHSNTEIALRAAQGRQSEHSVERDIRVARRLAWTRQPYFVPDVADPNEQFLVDDELRPYYEQAHVLSMAVFPVLVKDTLIGTITFSAAEHHDFDQAEQEFLGSLVAQAGPTIHAFILNRELRKAEQRLRAVFSNAPVFITVYEPDGTVALSEGAGLEGLGRVAGAMVGSSIYEELPGPEGQQVRANIERGLRGEKFESRISLSGRELETRYAPLRDENGEPTAVIGVTLDVSERYRAQRELEKLNAELQKAKESAEALARQAEESRRRAEYLASHDALTGVLSRRAWFEIARVNRPTAIAVFDVDRFKGINDMYGHPAGDVVLREVAERISAAMTDEEAVVGRLGGEEFGIVFTGPLERAERACERAVEMVADRGCELPSGEILRVTVSAGLAPCRRASDRADDAIDRAYEAADQALYRAKEAGRHRLVVSKAA